MSVRPVFRTWWFYAGAGLLGLVLLYDNLDHLRHDTGANNTHAWQAAAFLQGRLDLDRVLHDCVERNGKIYSYSPPLPAVLLVPSVAVFGVEGTNPFLIKLLLGAINVLVCHSLLRKLDVPRADRWWLIAGFMLGTAYWFCTIAFGVWWFSQVVAVTFLFAAINESLGRARGWLVGLFLGCAILSRQMSVYAGLFLLVAVWQNWKPHRPRSARLLNLAGFCLVGAASVAVYLWFNYACFGDPLTAGGAYVKVGPVWTANLERFGMMNLAYVPFNFAQMFFQGFHFEISDNLLKMDRNGTSITFASPFVFAAFWARWRRPLVALALTASALTLCHQLIYYSNGWAQVNAQRYTLDFLPLLFPLIALGVRRLPPALWKSAIAYSIILNLLALILLPRGWSLLTRFVTVAVGPSADP
jgi:hypothetical protein